MRTGQKLTPEILGSLVGAALLTAILAVGAVRAAEIAGRSGPGIGDIVDFRPGTTITPERADRIGVRTADARDVACLLDTAAMAADGGSLVVESLAEDGYRVHWAGIRTSRGSGDCGAARDLLISRPDLDQLASAAGGFGVGGTRRVPQASDPAPAM